MTNQLIKHSAVNFDHVMQHKAPITGTLQSGTGGHVLPTPILQPYNAPSHVPAGWAPTSPTQPSQPKGVTPVLGGYNAPSHVPAGWAGSAGPGGIRPFPRSPEPNMPLPPGTTISGSGSAAGGATTNLTLDNHHLPADNLESQKVPWYAQNANVFSWLENVFGPAFGVPQSVWKGVPVPKAPGTVSSDS